ncbi:hypothetical protein KY285_024463 [Solanum tuberosum]|nr:hypothetical protein KY285_024463 [Solanum tuberosum]
MVRGCGLGHHIDGSQVNPGQFLSDDQPNPDYHVWVRANQLVLSWIVASVSEGILPQLVGAETAQTAWNKLVAAYASASICQQLFVIIVKVKAISHEFAHHPRHLMALGCLDDLSPT